MPFLALVAGLASLSAGCTLVSPGCRNREVKATIEQEARDSIDFWLKTSQQQPLPDDVPLRLVEQLEVSRKDATRACSAKIAVGRDDKPLAVPIEYEVIAGDDGQAFYRWNKEEFGKAFIGASLLSILPNVTQQSANEYAKAKSDARTPPQAAENHAPPFGSGSGKRISMHPGHQISVDQWQDDVRATINAQSVNVRIEGSGSVLVDFDISPTGQLSDIKILQSSGSVALDRSAVQMVEKAGQVRPPPDQRPTRFSIKLAFL